MIDRAGMAIAENKEDYQNKVFYYDDRIRESKYWEQRLSGELENAIFSLETLPERGAVRRAGAYANQGYRQLFHKNYTIIYCVLKEKKEVHIVTVRYTPGNF